MLGNTGDIRKKTEEHTNDGASFGGFGGRLSYESRQTRASRLLGRLAIGTAMCLLLGTFGTLCGMLMFHLVSDNHSLYSQNLPLLQASADKKDGENRGFVLSDSSSNISVVHNSAAVENVTKEQSERYRIPIGVMVHELLKSGSLYNAGVIEGDIIVELDGTEINDFTQLNSLIGECKGKTVWMKVFRNNSYVKLYASFD